MKPGFAFWKKTPIGSTFFGHCESDGSTPSAWSNTFDWYGTYTWYGFAGTQDFICPGTGPQVISFMSMYGKTRGSPHGNVRMGVYTFDAYDSTLVKVCEWSAAILVNSATAQWWGDSQGLTGTTTIYGGQHYRIALSVSGVYPNIAYRNVATNTTKSISGADYTAGFPSSLTPTNQGDFSPLVRMKIVGDRTPYVAATREIYYVDTDYAGGDSTGSPAKPYINLQTAIAARCNKTFTLPIYIYCSGATADTIAVKDSALGQMVPSATNPLYIVGNRTLTTWDTSKYHLEPTDRTNYYGAINFTHNYVYMDRLQVYLPSTTVSVSNEIVYLSNTAAGSMTFSNGIVRAPGGSDATRYFSSGNGAGGIHIWNTLMYGMGTNNVGNGVKNHGVSKVYSCVIIANAADAVDNTDNSTITVKNCYLQSTYATGSIQNGTAATVNLTTTATSDAGGSVGLQNIAFNTSTFTNITTDNEDFSLPVGSGLIGTGTDTSGDTSPFNFTTDMIGAARTNPWDIGPINS